MLSMQSSNPRQAQHFPNHVPFPPKHAPPSIFPISGEGSSVLPGAKAETPGVNPACVFSLPLLTSNLSSNPTSSAAKCIQNLIIS